MDLVRSKSGSAVVLAASGRLNMKAATGLREGIAAAVQAESPRVVLDLAGVEFIDSSGLGAVISGLKAARQAGGDLRIAAAGEQVRAVLGLTNLDRVLRPHDSVADALADW